MHKSAYKEILQAYYLTADTSATIENRPSTIDKPQILQIKVSTVDEWLSDDTQETHKE